jgi:phosphatidylglycerophosphate synthase
MEAPARKATLADLKATYTDKKRAFDRENLYVYFVMRPLSWLPTLACLRLGITANGATWIGLLIGLAACAAFAFGGDAAFLAGALLYNLFFLFDHIDGNIARWHRKTNHYGKFIDGVFGAVLVMLLLLAMGYGLARAGEEPIHRWGSLLAFAAASAITFRFYIAVRLEHALQQAGAAAPAPPPGTQASGAAPGPGAAQAPRSALGRLRGALLFVEQSGLEGSLLLFAALGRCEWWILGFGPLLLANALLEIVRCLAVGARRLNVYRPF